MDILEFVYGYYLIQEWFQFGPNWAYAITMESRHGKKITEIDTQKSTNVLGLIIDDGSLSEMRICPYYKFNPTLK